MPPHNKNHNPVVYQNPKAIPTELVLPASLVRYNGYVYHLIKR